MITLAEGCLLFQLANGESVPFSPEMVSVELVGETSTCFDAEFVENAANAVFHYFKHDLGRQTVTVGEFTGALEKVLRGFKLGEATAPGERSPAGVLESDLCLLATESGGGCELLFFPRLRDELRHQMRQSPRVLRFRGLRRCVKQLAGVSRWNGRCQGLEEQIVSYLRECLSAETRKLDFALIVE